MVSVTRNYKIDLRVVDETERLMFLTGNAKYSDYFSFCNTRVGLDLAKYSGKDLYYNSAIIKSVTGDKKRKIAEVYLVYVSERLRDDNLSGEDDYYLKKVRDRCVEVLQ